MLVRSWNVYHGRSHPEGRTTYLEQAVQVASSDRPDVLCLQEVPVWALPRLAGWSGMEALGAVARRASIGPVPIPPALGRSITALAPRVLGSVFAGQANAILTGSPLRVLEQQSVVLNPRAFRRDQAGRLGLGFAARLRWAHERRVCQVARLGLADGTTVIVGNLHATSFPADWRIPDAEVLRAAESVSSCGKTGEPIVLGGDFNVTAGRSLTLETLSGPGWGFSRPGPGIDHVLVRGAPCSALRVWPEERRRLGSVLLSDHAPVEVEVEIG